MKSPRAIPPASSFDGPSAEVMEHQRRAAVILDGMYQFVALLSPTGDILEVNRIALEGAGHQIEEIRGKPFWTARWWQVSDQIREDLKVAIRRAASGEFVRYEVDFYGGQSRLVPATIDFSLQPIRGKSGEVEYLLAEGRNITERKVAAQASALLSAIVDSSDDAIISKDLNGVIMSWNKGAERMFGYTADEAIGQSIAMLIPPDRLFEEQRILEQLRRGERVDHFETIRVRKDGSRLNISLAISPVKDAGGRIVGASKVARNITEQKSISELQARLAAIVESSDDAIISKDLNGIIRSWNRGAERLFGYRADEIVGKHISTLAAPDRVDEIPDILNRIKRGERVDHYETRRRTKDGRILSVSLTISPIRDASGVIVGASKVARDITERERQEQLLRQANAALARSNADLQQFAYSASHDLQEPLRMVAIYSELLKQEFGERLGPNGNEYIGRTIRGALRMEQLLKDLRAYTLASSAGQEPTEDIDADQILDKALGNLEAAIRENNASISRTALPRVRIHGFQLEQLFQNLIGNSIHYRGSEPPRINIAAERQGKEWLFSVQDNGIGIDPQYKEQIFGIFQRLQHTVEYPGTGMGLAICQRIVERAGGRIWVESEPGQGATFFFTVPREEN